jgi:predicted house-cleaning noncanonical NTP pyrophosphatase (MazG superfamily)
MDIRSAQAIAWRTASINGIYRDSASLEFGLLSAEIANALDAWRNGRREITEELAAIAIFVLRLAEVVGTDLQKVLEDKLAVTTYEQPPSGPPVKDALVATTAAMNYGKLVRDKIPQIIRSKGLEPITYTADTEEYCIRLRDKLREEVEEYLASDNDREELADILEVLYALARQAGTDQQELEKLRAAKAEKRGGFADRTVWFCNEHPAAAHDARIAAAKL